MAILRPEPYHVISLTVSAQKSDSLRIQQKLDSLIMMQKQLQAMQQDIYQATVYVDPLVYSLTASYKF